MAEKADDGGRHARLTRAGGRIGPAVFCLGALAWSLLIAVSAVLSLIWSGWQDDRHIRTLALFFAGGALLAFPLSALTASFAADDGGFERRLAAHLLALAAFTVICVAAPLALHHRVYFAQWHASPFSLRWIMEFVFTVGGAVYQFAVLGVRLMLPVGLPALFGFALWLAVKAR